MQVCEVTDASRKNDEDCVCGYKVCDSFTGRVCYGPESKCQENTAPQSGDWLQTCEVEGGAFSQVGKDSLCGSSVCKAGSLCHADKERVGKLNLHHGRWKRAISRQEM